MSRNEIDALGLDVARRRGRLMGGGFFWQRKELALLDRVQQALGELAHKLMMAEERAEERAEELEKASRSVAREATKTVEEAIAAHKATCEVHDQFAKDFDKWGGIDRLPIDYVRFGRTWSREIAAFKKLVDTPCRTDADVQAKLAHFLDGAPEGWTSFIECMNDAPYSGDTECLGLLPAFLRSLVVTP